MAYKKYEYFKLNMDFESGEKFIEKSSGYKFQYEEITFFIEKYGDKIPTYTATEEKSGLKVLSGYKKLKYLKDDITENINKIKAALDRQQAKEYMELMEILKSEYKEDLEKTAFKLFFIFIKN